MKHSDIVIVGAGPAGCATSLFLAQKGIPHTIIDKQTFPRDKICGDALSGKVVYVLNQLDPTITKEFQNTSSNYTDSWGVKFVAPNGKAIDIPFISQKTKDVSPPGFISKRMDFDYSLFSRLNTTYAKIHQQTALTTIARNGETYTLGCIANNNETIVFKDVKLLIGAEGDRSIVAKQLANHRKENNHYCAGIRAYYEGVTDLHPENYIELHFLEELLPGYFWIFPLPNGQANIGAGMLSASVSKKKVNLKEDMLRAIANNPNIKHRFTHAKLVGKIQGWGLPLGSKKRSLCGDGFLLTGDAGSLIDPFTGEGIGNALYSGMLAADTIEHAIKANRFDHDFLKEYETAFYDRQWDELKMSHTLQRLCKFPWLFNFVVNKAHKNKALRETISCMFENADLRAKFRNPFFYFKLLFND
jgi:geranylgeranyl reductase family protein